MSEAGTSPTGCAANQSPGNREHDAQDILSMDEVRSHMKHDVELLWKRTTGTTNDDVRELAAHKRGPLALMAEQQCAGRGRSGRQWVSGNGTTVEMSILVRPDIPAHAAGGISFAVALAVSDAVEACAPDLRPRVKWPNDVELNGKKLCGILSETGIEADRLAYVVIGIGVNVNQEHFPGPLQGTATSMAIESGRRYDRALFAAALIDAVLSRIEQLAEEGIASIIEEYKEKSTVLRRTVNVITADGTITGLCIGFGPRGELLVKADGAVRPFTANDVSVREAPDV